MKMNRDPVKGTGIQIKENGTKKMPENSNRDFEAKMLKVFLYLKISLLVQYIYLKQ